MRENVHDLRKIFFHHTRGHQAKAIPKLNFMFNDLENQVKILSSSQET